MLRALIILFMGSAFAAIAAVVTVVWLYLPQLPSVETLRDIQLNEPLRVLTADGALMAEFGEKRREPVSMAEVPPIVADAFLAAEDDRFREHPGVDVTALVRAVVELARTGEKRQGGSTITMQVARNFFLTRDRTYERKIKEILLALKIERSLSKDEILELYLNKIFLGQRAYGVAAAARVYYGTNLQGLTLAQAAMLAGLPKAPSELNPIANPVRALERRRYVLGRMRELGMISEPDYLAASAAPITAERHTTPVEVEADYVAEEARAFAVDLLGKEAAYSGGYRLYTTLEAPLQRAATRAVQNGLIDFTERHGYRGAESRVELPVLTARQAASDAYVAALVDETVELRLVDDPLEGAPALLPLPASMQPGGPLAPLWPLAEETRVRALEALRAHYPIAGLKPAVVLGMTADSATLLGADGAPISLALDEVRWARRFIDADRRGPQPDVMADVFAVGDIVRVRWVPTAEEAEGQDDAAAAKQVDELADELAEGPADSQSGGQAMPGHYRLAALPEAEAALVSISPDDGRVLAMVGGFAFAKSKFNRAEQARRQPGSNFKPFIYSSAIDAGFTPASFINDAPIVFDAPGLESVWRPENYSGKYYGPTRLRTALAKSRNLVSIRLLREVGVDAAMTHIRRFGFDTARLPPNLSLALGSGEVAPVELVRGYAVFANGGFLVTPHVVDRIEAPNGEIIWRSAYPEVCRTCDMRRIRSDGEPFDVEAEYMLPDGITAVAPQVLDAANAWTMASMLGEVIQRGTGVRAKSLGRSDLAGKTGTTNDQKDAWFSGFNPDVVTTVWVGYDSVAPLGRRETGASAALPLWIDYMETALAGREDVGFPRPPGLVAVRIDPNTGLRAAPGDENAVFEYFKPESVPEAQPDSKDAPSYPNQLF